MLFLEVSKDGSADNRAIYIWWFGQPASHTVLTEPFLQLSGVSGYCQFQLNFQGFPKIDNFLLDPLVYVFFNEVKNFKGHPDKILVTWDISLY